MLIEKKHFWNNIGRCLFEVQNAGNPAKSGTLGALIQLRLQCEEEHIKRKTYKKKGNETDECYSIAHSRRVKYSLVELQVFK